MPMFFLVPLVAGLATGYISKKCQDEVGYLTGTFTVISLVLSLVLAPWQIQLALLILVLTSTHKFLKRN
ncbi:hypothetical protein [Nostoc sp. TCL26-01]|uniref:hypothetical protein n=1 Tax=Nostoc sp. TCL26-01 TaxID=2576904 RepID=UPI0015B7D1D5|nr:hypothetical protein [Nostoc sp. TCL26-01]QLE58457.1 hypothetical protein FD725_24860 [Nostoc sp. TCL26-01]